ncbi:MAG TPA: 1-phosphofructokinase family hexose kinase [Flexivirga sp.]|uniref:1-phosphofructokinase family hexose kinase n=1 Tax=Flexivirga sp. TaxID=1962927 RepID=UPI002B589571|nr:1-phosphofructokinase family hexose kinase [Flexivirga sp.]HWC22160.1 1-phosphofructokinase family hexose kinase [Flexivirga sp.]
MIITLTPNPSVDRTIAFDSIRIGEVQRATSSRIDPGGKGINVSRALVAQGANTRAVFPVGGPEGRLLAELLELAGVPRREVPISGTGRINIAAVTPDGTTTKLNEAGPQMTGDEVEALLAATLDAASPGDWVVGCGSLAPGAPIGVYADLVGRARDLGARVAIDSSGMPFSDAVAAKPSLIKPNHEELAELVGRSLPTLGDVVAAARDLVGDGIEMVVVSLGADGAIAVDAATHATTSDPGPLWAKATVERPLSTVGAGDCLLAGVLFGLDAGESLTASLERGVAWGAAAVGLPGSRVPCPADTAAIAVTTSRSPDLSMPIRMPTHTPSRPTGTSDLPPTNHTVRI